MNNFTTPTKTQDKPCQGCLYSRYNAQRGLFGAWECHHPDSLDTLPKLAVDLLDKTLHCRLLPVTEYPGNLVTDCQAVTQKPQLPHHGEHHG